MKRALAAAVLASGCGASDPAPLAERTNLLLITVSSLRADHLGIYGYPRNLTPRLDLLGASGAVFLEPRTPAPATGPAAAAVLTGLDPARVTRGEPTRLLPAPTLATTLRERGYRTLAAVDHPALAAELGFSQGFTGFREVWGLPAGERTEAVAAFGSEALAAAVGTPFFVWLHFSAPARSEGFAERAEEIAADGLTPSGPRFRPGVRPAGADPGGAAWGEVVNRYDAAVRSVDEALGRILDALAAGPARDRTLVALVGLHGESLGEHGPPLALPRALFRETLRPPLLFAGPESDPREIPSGVRFGSIVSVADLAPTALAWMGIPGPERPLPGTIGKSLLPALRGEDLRPHRRLHARAGSGAFAISDGRLKILRIPVPDQEPLFALFDLTRDPNEAENRYPEARASVEPLKARLETRRIQTVAWRQETTRNPAPDPPLSPELAAALGRLRR